MESVRWIRFHKASQFLCLNVASAAGKQVAWRVSGQTPGALLYNHDVRVFHTKDLKSMAMVVPVAPIYEYFAARGRVEASQQKSNCGFS